MLLLRCVCINRLWSGVCCLFLLFTQSLIAGDDFQHILRVLNTNVDGKQKVMYAITAIRGIGRRFSNLVCKKAEVDMRKRCGRGCRGRIQQQGGRETPHNSSSATATTADRHQKQACAKSRSCYEWGN